MSREQELIQREIASREPFKVGTVVGSRRLVQFDSDPTTPGIMYVCDVEIGSNRPLLNVPIKAGSNGGRFYALDGATVLLRRNLLGRWQVVGPGDRNAGEKFIVDYDIVTEAPVGTENIGTTRVIDPFEYYQGPISVKGNPALTLTQAANDFITRASGSFIDDGFTQGAPGPANRIYIGNGVPESFVGVDVPGTSGRQRDVDAVTDLVLTLQGTAFQSPTFGPASGITVGQVATSRWNDGVNGFPSRRIVDASGVTINPAT